jgi:hypothetical protein
MAEEWGCAIERGLQTQGQWVNQPEASVSAKHAVGHWMVLAHLCCMQEANGRV